MAVLYHNYDYSGKGSFSDENFQLMTHLSSGRFRPSPNILQIRLPPPYIMVLVPFTVPNGPYFGFIL